MLQTAKKRVRIFSKESGVMDILFSQKCKCQLGIEKCYLKHIISGRDSGFVTRKEHHHTCFEIHMIKKGHQVYEIDDKKAIISAGEFLLIPPLMKHKTVSESVDMEKYSLTFCFEAEFDTAISEKLPSEISDNIHRILNERKRKESFGQIILENRVFECVLLFLRMLKMPYSKENEAPSTNHVSTLAKQYVSDNLHTSVTVSEIACYCHISQKQLNRIFLQTDGVTVGKYVIAMRCKKIEELLADTSLPLSEISEMMGFANEYYFNTFFKRNNGMTPGAYRKSLQ